MKESLQCPKCESRKIGHFDCVFDYDGGSRKKRVLSSKKEHEFLKAPKWFDAPVEAYVCASCGYFEEYVTEPAAVPWEKLPNFRWCRPDMPEAPFR